MARYKDQNWSLPDKITTTEEAQVAILMDIRDELKELNRRASIAEIVRYQQRDVLNRIDRRARVYAPLTKRRRSRK